MTGDITYTMKDLRTQIGAIHAAMKEIRTNGFPEEAMLLLIQNAALREGGKYVPTRMIVAVLEGFESLQDYTFGEGDRSIAREAFRADPDRYISEADDGPIDVVDADGRTIVTLSSPLADEESAPIGEGTLSTLAIYMAAHELAEVLVADSPSGGVTWSGEFTREAQDKIEAYREAKQKAGLE